MNAKIIASSGQYSYTTIQAELLIREAFELIGISGNLIVAEQLEGAARSINFLLTDLANYNINLWTIQQKIISLKLGQTSYQLPSEIIKIIQVDLRTSTREINGIPFCSKKLDGTPDGVPENAFSNNLALFCDQTLPNGFIGIKYTLPMQIVSLGIKPQDNKNYDIIFEYSSTGNDNDWYNLSMNKVDTKSIWMAQETMWFNISNIGYYTYYRIKEKGGAILNINKLYFNDQVVDLGLSEISHYSYIRFPQKSNIGRSTLYSVDYQIPQPVINIWQAPEERSTYLLISYQAMIESLNSYTESLNIPNSFYQAIVYGLAKSLAMKYSPDKLQYISPEFDKTLNICLTKNTNDLPLQFSLHVDK